MFDPQTGEIDRAALRSIIFEDEEQRKRLNRITHPEIYKEMYASPIGNVLYGIFQFCVRPRHEIRHLNYLV